jgi:hypothetical protein
MNMKKLLFISTIFLLFMGIFAAVQTAENVKPTAVWQKNSRLLQLTKSTPGLAIKPLDWLVLESSQPGRIEILDGAGVVYFTGELKLRTEFRVGGALGNQIIELLDSDGKMLDRLSFPVECQTEIREESGKYQKLLDILYHTMIGEEHREASTYRYQGRDYSVFVPWLRDHVHTLKGMKYFYPELKSGIDLYADSQREDGMIWDNYYNPWSATEGSYWVQRFRYENFVRVSEADNLLFTRIPVENDVEYLFIEGIYFTWKATGDAAWMQSRLDHALKALDYTQNDPLRWSEKFGLLKRGYTIDTWDFQNDEDAAISVGAGQMPDAMVIRKDKTRFGIMFGDNTGMAAACGYLAEMLEFAGRTAEAEKIGLLGKEIQKRIDALSWNGKFYRHHVPEDAKLVRDLGVDEATQVSLSNAYSLNRSVSHAQAVEILKTYQRIREEMPETSPGEFYTIFPPFEKGYGGHNSKWNYMNGGVTSIVAGELAHGAFEHGFEGYGVDILDRILKIAQKTNNYLHCTYRGQMPVEPARNFQTVNLRKIANTDFYGKTSAGVQGWTGEGENDLHEFPVGRQEFENIPFDVIDPAANGRRACLGISVSDGSTEHAKLPVQQKGQSVYLLHIANNSYYAGRVTLIYADGTEFADEIGPGKIQNWWYPSNTSSGVQMPKMKVAWRGKNAKSDRVGVCVYGLNNPWPEKAIQEIRFTAAQNGTKWMLLGVTLSDAEVHFVPDIVSGGIPDNWGAAAVVYALVEGLAGVKDLGVGMNRVMLAPRWEAAGVKQATACIQYAASGGYLAYNYQFAESAINLEFTGTGASARLQLLLPENFVAEKFFADHGEIPFEIIPIEKSRYLVSEISGNGVHQLKIVLKRL